MTDAPRWMHDWFEPLVEASDLRTAETTLDASSHWSLSDGGIRHDSGRFFSVVGITWDAGGGARTSQPLLEQKEEGTLGFLIRREGARNEVLAYAKIEPGNVNTVQFAPTCQATRSNISRAHGGEPPPFSDIFEHPDHRFLYDVAQSEQGTRFLGKLNRNILASASGDTQLPLTHRWLAVEELFELVEVDFAVNTDARSVLVSSPWETLVGRTPFGRHRSGFGAELAISAANGDEGAWYELLSERMRVLRSRTARPAVVDLRELEGWLPTDRGIEPESDAPFGIRQIKVDVNGREVSSWDQPIVSSAGEGSVDLVCGRAEGLLRFLLRPYAEPGLHNLVQLGPTAVVEPGSKAGLGPLVMRGAVTRVDCLQSEEGGRFYHDTNRFRILDIGEADEAPDGWHWLTLSQIRILLNESGWLTNEARSALSLLLKWL